MGTPSPTPERVGTKGPVEIDVAAPGGGSPAAVWRQLTAGFSEPWLREIGLMRVDDDDLERSMDIWSVMLIAALRVPERRKTAAAVIARLRRLSDAVEA